MESNVKEQEEKLSVLQKRNEELTTEIEQLKKQLTESNNLILEKSQMETNFKDSSDEDKKIIAELQSQLNGLIKDNQNFALEIEKIRNANEIDRQMLSDGFETEKSELLNQCDTLKQSYELSQTELNQIKDKDSNLKSQLEEFTIRLNEKQTEVNDLKGALEQLQRKRSQENDEMLSEMREITEALKNRGEVISKQNQSIGELNDKIDQLQQQMAQLNIVNDAANREIEQMHDRIKEMENKSIVDGKLFVLYVSRLANVYYVLVINKVNRKKRKKFHGGGCNVHTIFQEKRISLSLFHFNTNILILIFFHFQTLKCPYPPYREQKKLTVCETLKKVSRKNTTN